MALTVFNWEYFLRKDNADCLINLVNYINREGIVQEQLEDRHILMDLIRNGMRFKDELSKEQLDEFKVTICNFGIDYLQRTNLYRLNHGILAVACMKYLLFPRAVDEQYFELYRCDIEDAAMLYNMLDPTQEPNDDTKRSTKSFFTWPNHLKENGCLGRIRSYLQEINIESDELDDIRQKSIEAIKKGAETVLDPVSPVPVPMAVPADDEEPRPLTPRPLTPRPLTPRPLTPRPLTPRPLTPMSVDPAYLSAVTKPINLGFSQRDRDNIINQRYFRQRIHADAIIDLQKFLIKLNIQQDDLEKDYVLTQMIRKTIEKRPNKEPTKDEKEQLKRTIFLFSLDFLKAINLYRINHGILMVACIELVLYPDRSDEEYKKIYLNSVPLMKKVYKELCGIPKETKLEKAIVKSARRFFFCRKYADDGEYLKKIRSYLQELVRAESIDDDEKQFIRERVIQLITGNEDIQMIQPPENNTDPIEDQAPTSSETQYMNREYFLKQSNADLIIILRKYLIDNDIKRENLENEEDLIGILRAGTRRHSNFKPTNGELDTLKRTLLNFTIDYLKEADLYRMNRGILLIACVECLLFPDKDVKQYSMMYDSKHSMATELYNKLCGFPKHHKPDDAIVKSAECFFQSKMFSRQRRCLEPVRSYLNGIIMNDEKLKFIKETSILLINDRAAMDTVKPPPIKTKDLINTKSPTLPAKAQSRLSAPKAPVEIINLQAHLPISRMSDDFARRYQPGQTVFARKLDSNFWPAKIIKIDDHWMNVKFFPLSEKEDVIALNEDVKEFRLKGIPNPTPARSPDLTRECFMNALALACAELGERIFT